MTAVGLRMVLSARLRLELTRLSANLDYRMSSMNTCSSQACLEQFLGHMPQRGTAVANDSTTQRPSLTLEPATIEDSTLPHRSAELFCAEIDLAAAEAARLEAVMHLGV